MSNHIDNNLSNFSQSYSNKIPTSGFVRGGLKTLLVCLVAVNVVFSFLFGVMLGDGWFEEFLIGFGFVLLEICLAALSFFLLSDKIKQGFGYFALVGLFFLSILTAASYMIAKQYKADNFEIESQKTVIATIQKRLGGLDPAKDKVNYRDASRELTKEQRKLEKLKKESGAVGTANAIFKWAGGALGVPYELVSLAFRVAWSLLFVAATVAIGSLISRCYTAGAVLNEARIRGVGVAATKQAEDEFKELVSGNSGGVGSQTIHYSTGTTQKRPKSTAKARKAQGVRDGDSFDTGVSGANSSRYEAVKGKVLSGEVSPVVAAVRREAKCGAGVAQGYLEAMANDGVLNSKLTPRGVKYSLNS